MTTPDFQAMTTDELVAYKRSRKEEMEAIREDVRGADAVYTERIAEEHVAEAVRQVEAAASREGRTPEEQARYWLANQWADEGRHILARRYLERRLINARDLEGLRAADEAARQLREGK